MFKIHDFLRLYYMYLKVGHDKQTANSLAYKEVIGG